MPKPTNQLEDNFYQNMVTFIYYYLFIYFILKKNSILKNQSFE